MIFGKLSNLFRLYNRYISHPPRLTTFTSRPKIFSYPKKKTKTATWKRVKIRIRTPCLGPTKDKNWRRILVKSTTASKWTCSVQEIPSRALQNFRPWPGARCAQKCLFWAQRPAMLSKLTLASHWIVNLAWGSKHGCCSIRFLCSSSQLSPEWKMFNQIDYVVIDGRYFSSILLVRTFGGLRHGLPSCRSVASPKPLCSKN